MSASNLGEGRLNGAELAGVPLGAGEDAVPGPGRDELVVYRALFRDAPGDRARSLRADRMPVVLET